VWSGGSFIYVPKGVHVEIPLQAYFRINTENMGQFERTLIIADEGSYVHYVEGCTAPIYKSDSLHSAVVEIIVKKGARVRTRRSRTGRTTCTTSSPSGRPARPGHMEWIDGNIGSKVTMKYPAVWLMGEHAKGERCSRSPSPARASTRTPAPRWCTPRRTPPARSSPSRWRGGGRAVVPRPGRGAAQAPPLASSVKCDALLVDTVSRSDTYPYVDVQEDDVSMAHEATVSKVSPRTSSST
jgi:Fe-S cluster assembly protein SufB